MSRSLKKGPFIEARLMKKVINLKPGDKTVINTYSRRATITPEMVGHNFGVHNGKLFIRIFVNEDMVGHKLGEFSPTKKFIMHSGKIAKEQKASSKNKA